MSEITLLYVHGESIGYARMGSQIAASLTRQGVDIYDDLGPGPEKFRQFNEIDRVNLDLMRAEDRRSKLTNAVCWMSVPTHARWWYRGQHPSIMTMWEASRLPESFRENLHEFTTVFVPSEHNLELFSKYHSNVKLVPLGVDPIDWHYVARKEPTRYFNFLIGGSGARKGPDLAFEAFTKVFGGRHFDGPTPRLIMKSPKGGDFVAPNVEIVAGRLSNEQEINLYEDAHCYLQPSRGEGFGLQPLQAIAQGIPTILTSAHGHAGFAHLGYGLSATMAPAAYFIYGDAGEWWEPSFDELCDRMDYVYNHYDEALLKAEHSAEVIARDWTWDRTAERFTEILGDELTKPYTGDKTFVEAVSRHYPIITNRDWVGDIAGVLRQFTKGETYYDVADVKRILFEAEVLDPACLSEEDTGLAPQQVERLGLYVASHSHCKSCGQKINESRTRADEIEEQLNLLAPWQRAVWEMAALLPDDVELPPSVIEVMEMMP